VSALLQRKPITKSERSGPVTAVIVECKYVCLYLAYGMRRRSSSRQNMVPGYPAASVFHNASWLEALKTGYDHQPMALTTSDPDRRNVMRTRLR